MTNRIGPSPTVLRSTLLALITLSIALTVRAADTAHPQARYLIVVGMASEAKIALGENVFVVTGAMREQSLRATLSKLDTTGFKAVISFGVAGGLRPQLKVGDLIIPDQVVSNGRTWNCSPALNSDIRAGVARAGVPSIGGIIVGTSELASGSDKWRASLRAQTHGEAVDMETQVAAEFAASRGLPFAAIRTLSDAVGGGGLPPAALLPLDENGDVQMGDVFGSILSDPSQIGALIKVGNDFKKATSALARVRRSLDSMFGVPPPAPPAPAREENF